MSGAFSGARGHHGTVGHGARCTWRGVLYDLDGTLLDTAPDFIVVLNAMLTDRGLAPLPYADIRAVVSNGARALVKLGFGGDPGEPAFELLNEELRDRYSRHLAVHTRLFPGLESVLERCDALGVPWGIVTNKPSLYTLPLLDALGLRTRCATVVCPDQVTQTKPHPEPMFKAAAEMGIAPQDCVYVGDHARDIAAGRNAGMATIAAGWGYIGPDEHPREWHADFIVDSVAEYAALLFGKPPRDSR